MLSVIAGQIKRHSIKMSTKSYGNCGGNLKVELELSYYATKVDLKEASDADASNIAAKSDLPNLKAEVDELDIDKVKTVPTDLSKPSNGVG